MSNSASVVIQVVKDRGATATGSALKGSRVAAGKSSQKFIRRPTRGLQIKEDTFATIRLVALVDGRNLPIVDAGSRRTDGGGPITVNGKRATDIYSNFLLQQVNEERAEKAQILETFGEPYIFLFGERPRMITFQGILVTSFDFNWEAEWWYNYDNFLRGTRCIEQDARVYIQYDQVLVGGYILGANASNNALEPRQVNFSFQVFVTSYTNFSDIGNPNARPGGDLSPEYTGGLQEENLSITLQQRPVLIPYDEKISGGPISGVLEPPDLFTAFSEKVAQVSSTWAKAGAMLNTAIAGVSGQLDPAVIRVPYGFAGALEFDDSARVHLYTVSEKNYSTSVKYGIFADNDDEYVGSGDAYGSSELRLTDFGFETTDSKLEYGQKMFNTAAKAWTEAGYPIELAQAGDLVRSMVGGTLGLIVSGITPIATAASAAGSAAPPSGAGLAKAITSLPVE